MKYTLFGYNQAELLRLKLDLIDAAVLRWFQDFYSGGVMDKIIVDDVQYCWVLYGYVLEQLPIVRIRYPRNLSTRFSKYVKLGILKQKIVHSIRGRRGTYTMFSPTKLLYSMAYVENDPICQIRRPPSGKSDAPPSGKSDTKDSSITDSSIRDTARAPRNRKGQERKAHIENVVNKIFGGKSA